MGLKKSIFITLFIGLFSSLIFSTPTTQHEVRLGTRVAATILAKYEQTAESSLIRYVNLVGQSIVKTSGRKDIQYYFTVLASNDLFALACPGGFIFITEGMVKQLKNEAELAGVLAHEIAHINQKHIFDQLKSNEDNNSELFHRLLMAKHTTGTVAFHEIGSKASELLLNKGMHQNDEYEADIAAVFYLKNTGYLPQSYIDVIQRLPHDTTTHTHDHPSIDQRIADVTAMFPADYLKTGVTLEGRFNRHALR